jgi:hypothetical protein
MEPEDSVLQPNEFSQHRSHQLLDQTQYYLFIYAYDGQRFSQVYQNTWVTSQKTVILIFIAVRTSDLGLTSAINDNQFQWSILNPKEYIWIFEYSQYINWLRAGRQRSRSSNLGSGILFSMSSRRALGPTQPPIQWVPKALSLEVKRPGREADHSTITIAAVKKTWIYTSTPILRRRDVLLNYLSIGTTARGATFRYGGGHSDPFRLYRQDSWCTFLTETPLQTSGQLPPVLQLRNPSWAMSLTIRRCWPADMRARPCQHNGTHNKSHVNKLQIIAGNKIYHNNPHKIIRIKIINFCTQWQELTRGTNKIYIPVTRNKINVYQNQFGRLQIPVFQYCTTIIPKNFSSVKCHNYKNCY